MADPDTAAPRMATPADAETLGRLLDAFNREYDVESPGSAVVAGRLARMLAGGQAVALLAGDPAQGLALLSFRPNVWYDGPVGLLDELYVVPGARGRGVGSALLAAAEHATRQRGGERLETNVDGEDTDARRFYERHGYTCTEPGEAEPDLCYARELGPPAADAPTIAGR